MSEPAGRQCIQCACDSNVEDGRYFVRLAAGLLCGVCLAACNASVAHHLREKKRNIKQAAATGGSDDAA